MIHKQKAAFLLYQSSYFSLIAITIVFETELLCQAITHQRKLTVDLIIDCEYRKIYKV